MMALLYSTYYKYIDSYQNLKLSSIPFLVPNTEEVLLETVKTEGNEIFYVSGEDYIKEIKSANANF